MSFSLQVPLDLRAMLWCSYVGMSDCHHKRLGNRQLGCIGWCSGRMPVHAGTHHVHGRSSSVSAVPTLDTCFPPCAQSAYEGWQSPDNAPQPENRLVRVAWELMAQANAATAATANTSVGGSQWAADPAHLATLNRNPSRAFSAGKRVACFRVHALGLSLSQSTWELGEFVLADQPFCTGQAMIHSGLTV